MEPFIRITAANRDEWLKNRTVGIGGSDAAAILGVSPFKTNEMLYNEKVGNVKRTSPNTEATEYGHNAEDSLRNLFMLDHPEYDLFHDEFMVLQSTKYPFMQASLDGELIERNTLELGFYEGKTAFVHNAAQLREWKENIPIYYHAQCVHYFNVTDYSFCWLRVKIKLAWNPNEQIIRDYYLRKEDVREDMDTLIDVEKDFWYNNIMKGEKPGLKLPEI